MAGLRSHGRAARRGRERVGPIHTRRRYGPGHIARMGGAAQFSVVVGVDRRGAAGQARLRRIVEGKPAPLGPPGHATVASRGAGIGASVKIAVTGSGGLIGSSLVPYLRSKGHEVIPIVRGKATGDEVLWDPEKGTIDFDKLQGIDGAVHLAGAGVGDRRWSPGYKQVILSSRVDGTTTLAEGDRQLAGSALGHGECVGRGLLRTAGRRGSDRGCGQRNRIPG